MPERRLIVEIVGDDASLQRALGSASASTAGFGDRLSSAGRRISSVGRTLTTHLTLPLVAVGAVATKAAVDFQSSMELLHTQAGVGQKAVDGLSKSVLSLAGPTATAPNALAAGLYHLASQGLRGRDSLNALKIAAEGAKLGQANLEDVTNALGAVIVSQIPGVHSYGQAMGELNAIVGTGDMRMQDLADAMGTGLPAVAKIAGVSLKDVGGALATFGDNNIRGARAGTLLNSTLRIMSSPSKAAQTALAGVGISATQLGNTLRSGGLVGAIQLLKDKMDAAGLSATQQGILLTQAFGGRQATGVKILLDEFDRLKKKTGEVGASGAKFAADWTAYTKTTAYHLAQAGAQMQATGVTIGTILLPIVAKVADVIGHLAARFDALGPSTKKAILIIAGIAAALGPVLGIVGSVTQLIGGAITAFGGLADVLVPIAAAVGAPVAAVATAVVAIGALVAAIAAAVLWPGKLKSVLERMGLSAHAAGEIVRGLQDVFRVVSRAAMALVQVVRENWPQISQIIREVAGDVKTIVQALVKVVEALWRTFGGTLTAIAKTAWSYIKATVKNGLEVIRGIVDVITGLIHGDWSKVWNGIKEIVGGTLKQLWNELKTNISLLGDQAKLIGTALYKGVIQPILHLGAELLHDIEHAIEWMVNAITHWIPSEAGKIGKGIADGILHGVSGLGSSMYHSVTGGLGGALHGVGSVLGINSPSRVWATKIGQPIAAGIVLGYLEGARALPSTITGSVRQALEAAKQAVDGYRAKFASAFSSVKSAVDQVLSGSVTAAATNAGKQLKAYLAQFQSANISGPVSAGDTEAGKQLAALQAQHDAAAQQQALVDAQTQLTQAQSQLSSDQAAGADSSTLQADQAAVVAAQQAVADAQYQIQVSALQQQAQLEADQANQQAKALQAEAAREAKHANAMRAQRKHDADIALAQLEKRLAREGATQSEAQAAIVKLLRRYGITYREVAADMGRKFAQGLESSIHLTAKAAEELAREIAKYLPHSPAEKGPLSTPIGWENFLLHGLPEAAGAASATLNSALTAPAPSARAAGTTAAGDHAVSGYLGNDLATNGPEQGKAFSRLLAVLTDAATEAGKLDKALASATASATGSGRASGGSPAAGTGSIVIEHLEVNAPNYVGSRRELEDTIVDSLSRWGRRNGVAQIRTLLGAH